MRIKSYDREIVRTCRKCFTILDFKRDYCCAKSKKECFADIGLVNRGLLQDKNVARRLFRKKRIDFEGNIINKVFFVGLFRNDCLVYEYRPPGCRSHFCWKWDDYINRNPLDFVYANIEIVSTSTLRNRLMKEFEYGIRLAYPGGFIIYTDEPARIKKEIMELMKEMKLKHFVTAAELMDPEKNRKEGVEIIMDKDGIIGKPRLFDTIIKNNMFMLVRMKMNMGSTGHEHSNIMITTADPDRLAEETPASLKSFHALRAFRL